MTDGREADVESFGQLFQADPLARQELEPADL